MTDFLILIDRNAFGFFIITLALIMVFYKIVTAFIERNKPACECDCCQDPVDEDEDEEDEDEEDEVIARGGREEEDE